MIRAVVLLVMLVHTLQQVLQNVLNVLLTIIKLKLDRVDASPIILNVQLAPGCIRRVFETNRQQLPTRALQAQYLTEYVKHVLLDNFLIATR